MTTGGIAFLAAFPLMIGLIVWVVWSFVSDQAKGTPFLTDVTPAPPSANATPVSPAKTYSNWSSFAFGVFAVIFGVAILIFAESTSNPLISSSFQTRTKAAGIILLGLWGIFRSFRHKGS